MFFVLAGEYGDVSLRRFCGFEGDRDCITKLCGGLSLTATLVVDVDGEFWTYIEGSGGFDVPSLGYVSGADDLN